MGVNKFVSPYPKITDLLRVDPEEARKQRLRLDHVKQNRDQAKVAASLKNLEEVAGGCDNTMPAILECVESYASIGEICDVLRQVFGTQREYLVF